MDTSDLVLSSTGKLSTKQAEELKVIKKKVIKVNSEIANIAQSEEDNFLKLKKLREKKKELTRKVDDEMKDLKTEVKRLKDKKLLFLGEKMARYNDLKELGLKPVEVSETRDEKRKKFEIEEAKVK